MTKIATTSGSTVWKCDRDGILEESPNAFIKPLDWFSIVVEHKLTHETKIAQGDFCSKKCLLEGIQFNVIGF